MKRSMISLGVVFLLIQSAPLWAASAFIFEGKLSTPDGKPIPGAELQLLDGSGNARCHVLSDMEGLYRFPLIMSAPGQREQFGIAISHLRYRPVKINDAVSGARLRTPGAADLTPTSSAALLLSTRIVQRDFVLTPSPGVPQHPNLGPLDPNYAEYCYQRAHLLLGQNRNKEAVEFLKIYAQIGGNRKQIARALQLVAQHDKQ